MKFYIDPGTGSMLFSLIIGLATTLVFVGKGLWIKAKQRVKGGKVEQADDKIPFVIFSDHKRYWNVFESICNEFEKREAYCEYWTMSSDDPALSKEYKFVKCSYIGEGSMAFAKLNMMNAHICLSTTPGLDVLQWKRSKKCDYYVHIYHAMDDGTGYRMFALDHYDAVLLNGEVQRQPIEELERLREQESKELVLAGSTYMDALLHRKESATQTPEKPAERTILCAPSWGASSILNKYGESFIDALVKTGYNIVIRPHPQSFTADKELIERLQKKYPESELFHWNRDNDNFDILSRSDLLISDFSGVIFDFCLTFDRPIIYADTEFDKAPYDAAWLDGLPWHVANVSKVGKKLAKEDFPNLKAIIDSVIADDRYAQGRREARELLWANQGNATQTIVDYLIDKSAELSKE